MRTDYETPEAVEIAKADSIILGEKDNEDWDQPTMSFVKTHASVVDVDA
jgi:hypothetical protein